MKTTVLIEYYYSRGLPVLPVAGKRALVEGWPTKPREELIVSFKKHGDCNVAIRLDGLAVLDTERPELWGLFFSASPEKIATRTWICRTGGGGFHIYFKGEVKPIKASGFAELRSGYSQYTVAPPSIHPETGRPYMWLYNIETVDIGAPKQGWEDRAAEIIGALAKYGGLIQLLKDVWRPQHRHNLALSLAGYFRKIGVSKKDAEVVISATANIRRSRCYRDNRTATRTKTVKDERKQKKRVKYIVGGEVIDGKLVEIVETDQGPRLLVWDESSLTVCENFKVDNTEYRPFGATLYALIICWCAISTIARRGMLPTLYKPFFSCFFAFFTSPGI